MGDGFRLEGSGGSATGHEHGTRRKGPATDYDYMFDTPVVHGPLGGSGPYPRRTDRVGGGSGRRLDTEDGSLGSRWSEVPVGGRV